MVGGNTKLVADEEAVNLGSQAIVNVICSQFTIPVCPRLLCVLENLGKYRCLRACSH